MEGDGVETPRASGRACPPHLLTAPHRVFLLPCGLLLSDTSSFPPWFSAQHLQVLAGSPPEVVPSVSVASLTGVCQGPPGPPHFLVLTEMFRLHPALFT